MLLLHVELTKCMHAIAVIKITTTSLDHQHVFQLSNYSYSQLLDYYNITGSSTQVIGEQLACLAIG